MKWFKHFSDMHEGETINELFDQMGHKGLSFFLLQELCCEKLEKNKDQSITEADCLFRFPVRNVRQKLRLSAGNLSELLRICATKGQLSYNFDGNILEIKMPILLYLLDSDSKKARHERAKAATQSRLDIDKEREEELDKDKELQKPKKGSIEPAANLPDLAPKKTNQFISKYCQLFKNRYGSNPVISQKIAGIAKRISTTLGEEKAVFYLEAFFAMPDANLVKNKHPLTQFEFKLNEITVFANSGKFTTQSEANNMDKKVVAVQTSNAFKEGHNF